MSKNNVKIGGFNGDDVGDVGNTSFTTDDFTTSSKPARARSVASTSTPLTTQKQIDEKNNKWYNRIGGKRRRRRRKSGKKSRKSRRKARKSRRKGRKSRRRTRKRRRR